MLSYKRMPGKFSLPKMSYSPLILSFPNHCFIQIKCAQKVTTTCTKYVWIGKAENINKSPIEWEKLCKPRVAVGLNMIDVDQWN